MANVPSTPQPIGRLDTPPGGEYSTTRRAFVVQFRTDADIGQGEFRGRVEHVRSGDACHFQSLDELHAFMIAAVSMHEAPRP